MKRRDDALRGRVSSNLALLNGLQAFRERSSLLGQHALLLRRGKRARLRGRASRCGLPSGHVRLRLRCCNGLLRLRKRKRNL